MRNKSQAKAFHQHLLAGLRFFFFPFLFWNADNFKLLTLINHHSHMFVSQQQGHHNKDGDIQMIAIRMFALMMLLANNA